jgi:hypothetical protein
VGTDGSKNHVEVAKNFVVPEPEDCPTVITEPAVSRQVGWMFEVLAAVTFDDESVSDADEVDDVGAYDNLTPVPAGELLTSKR